ncbi:AAA family ATPase, partial [Arcobacteraceae bacterium]|nr:AAA family ATPase [Arcobacteraceae bacterium]
NIMGTTKQRPNYPFAIYQRFNKFKSTMQTELFDIPEKKVEQKNFYIVIDEINRGNISKIFGELITLIEEDKRDSYEVTLPYSKEKFKIPSNLYIIATMNSTDKSIATIDIALRRRFTFLKMEPKPSLVKNEKAKLLMKELNQYISKSSLGKDYQLGHSYFMKIENEEDLEFVKDYKIKPLLEEYFYADSEKLDIVLEILNN